MVDSGLTEDGWIPTDMYTLRTRHPNVYAFGDVASVGSYVILSEWERKEDFDAFLHSDAFKNAVAWGKAEILRSRPRHKVYTND